jgi:hypothetical protein
MRPLVTDGNRCIAEVDTMTSALRTCPAVNFCSYTLLPNVGHQLRNFQIMRPLVTDGNRCIAEADAMTSALRTCHIVKSCTFTHLPNGGHQL